MSRLYLALGLCLVGFVGCSNRETVIEGIERDGQGNITKTMEFRTRSEVAPPERYRVVPAYVPAREMEREASR